MNGEINQHSNYSDKNDDIEQIYGLVSEIELQTNCQSKSQTHRESPDYGETQIGPSKAEYQAYEATYADDTGQNDGIQYLCSSRSRVKLYGQYRASTGLVQSQYRASTGLVQSQFGAQFCLCSDLPKRQSSYSTSSTNTRSIIPGSTSLVLRGTR